MFSEKQRNHYRDRLRTRIEALRAETGSSADQRKVVKLDQQSVGRLSRMDALQQQAMAKATDRRRHAEIIKAEAALKAIDEGEFGYCQECGDEIGTARLDHDPALLLCFSCAKAR